MVPQLLMILVDPLSNDMSQGTTGGWDRLFWFVGAASFTVFVKGAGFSSRDPPRAKEGRIGIVRWEQRMAAQKTRTLEQRKGAAPKLKSTQKRGRPPADDACEKYCDALRVTHSMAAYFRARFRIEGETINHGQQCQDGN